MSTTASEGAPAAAELTERERKLGIAAAIACITAFGASAGLSFPFFSVLMDGFGWSRTLIGLNTAMMAVASLAAAPFAPGLIRTVGLRAFLVAGAVITASGVGGIYFAGESVAIWFFFRLLIGVGGVMSFIGSEIWINMNAAPARRGAALGWYATALAGGFASGPIMLEITGYEGAAPFIAGVALILLAIPPVLAVKAPAAGSDRKGEARRIPSLARRAPAIFSAPATFAASEATIMSLVPVYVIALGFGDATANRVITVYGVGTIATQWLIGRMADRAGPVAALIGCAAVGVAGAALLPLASGSLAWLYPLLFLWGGVIVGVYTVGLALLGDRFPRDELSTANTGFVMSYNVGALIGPFLAGASMDLFGPQGLPVTLAGVFALYLALAISRRRAETP